MFSTVIRADAPTPPGLDTTYDKWSRQDYKTLPGGESFTQLHAFLLNQATIRGLGIGQQNQKNSFLKFLMMKYDNLLSEDNKLGPTRRKTLATLAGAALKYTNEHPSEVAALEPTTGGEVFVPGLELPPLQLLTGRLREMAEAADQELQQEEQEENEDPVSEDEDASAEVHEREKKRRRGDDHRSFDRSLHPSVPFPIVTETEILKCQQASSSSSIAYHQPSF